MNWPVFFIVVGCAAFIATYIVLVAKAAFVVGDKCGGFDTATGWLGYMVTWLVFFVGVPVGIIAGLSAGATP